MNILLIILSLYALLILYLIIVILRNNEIDDAATDPEIPVSIVIPFRNEALNLPGLIESLKMQSYSGEIELVLINDNSDDESVSIVQHETANLRFDTRILQLNFDPSRKLTSKQQALDLGIRSASNNLVILTDADMMFDKQWATALVKRMLKQPEPALVFGHSSISPIKTMFDLFQAFQLEFLFSVAYAFHLGKITGSCMGNNLILSRKQYIESGGFDLIGYSIVEDRALFAAYSKMKKAIAFSNPFFPTAFTPPVSTYQLFSQQILRWSRGGLTLSSNLIIPAMLLFVQILSLIFSFSILPLNVAILSTGNFFLTWLFIRITFFKTGSKVSALIFPVWIFFLSYELIIFLSATLFRKKIIWKGRDV
ncbi:MAG: glycosyltransferase [Chitinispirillaceae bacterium]|nr:glycosyltransferase [Chitinispirillaceae bacterium]